MAQLLLYSELVCTGMSMMMHDQMFPSLDSKMYSNAQSLMNNGIAPNAPK